MMFATRRRRSIASGPIQSATGHVDFEAVLGALPVNVLVLDPRTAAITYANRCSVETLASLRAHLPASVDPDRMVGLSMDVFHANPDHQRAIVGDPSRLPWRTKIRLGPKTLDLHVSAVRNGQGDYIAAVLSWADMSPLADAIASFDGTMRSALTEAAGATDGMRRAADSVLTATVETAGAAVEAATNASDTTVNVQSVAAAVEEFSASNAEITRQMNHSSSVTARAVTGARLATDSVRALVEASDRIGKAVGMISAIADQTNLLALNATIEAARAGAAGRSFAVVASEVKELAGQTSRATSEIAEQIGKIQAATTDTASSIHRIAEVIDAIDEGSSAVAAAAEEQAAVVSEIGRNARDAADLTIRVDRGIRVVSDSAEISTTSVNAVVSATHYLDAQMAEVTQAVQAFLVEVRRI